MKNLKHHLKMKKPSNYFLSIFYEQEKTEDEVLLLHRPHKINVNISFAIIDFGLKEFAYYYFFLFLLLFMT